MAPPTKPPTLTTIITGETASNTPHAKRKQRHQPAPPGGNPSPAAGRVEERNTSSGDALSDHGVQQVVPAAWEVGIAVEEARKARGDGGSSGWEDWSAIKVSSAAQGTCFSGPLTHSSGDLGSIGGQGLIEGIKGYPESSLLAPVTGMPSNVDPPNIALFFPAAAPKVFDTMRDRGSSSGSIMGSLIPMSNACLLVKGWKAGASWSFPRGKKSKDEEDHTCAIRENLRQASRALSQGKAMILSDVAESKKEHGQELLDKFAVGMQELQSIVEGRDRTAVAPKQKELLQYVGGC